MYKANNWLKRFTAKIYYQKPYLKSCEAKVVKITGNKIELDRTVAYPEGGGQEGDRGYIEISDGRRIQFIDTQKAYGRPIYLEDFPSIKVENIIHHIISDDDLEIMETLEENDLVKVLIDIERREKLSLSHSASHLVFVGVGQIRPEAIKNVKGCHIKEDSARFDFAISDRFSIDEIEKIKSIANDMVIKNYEISSYHHSQESEAWYWEANSHIIPCGGTHLTNTSPIGEIHLKRKSVGKNVERLSIKFPHKQINLSKYHE